MLMLGGGSLGANSLSEDTKVRTNFYLSQGVLKPGEPLNLFEIVDERISGTPDAVTEFNVRKSEITKPLEPIRIATTENRGDYYIEEVDSGRRHYGYDGNNIEIYKSPLRWLFIPALAFLFGASGCFFISFRWR